MSPNPLSPNSKIIIIGAGVFGLSTTLHLLKRGYKNIHIFDCQPLDKSHYSEEAGANGASCDVNKILRASYGGRKLYQDLAFKAMPEWQKWNEGLARCSKAELPESLDPNVKLWYDCGFLRLVGKEGLDKEEIETQRNFPEEIRHTQYRISDSKRREDALRNGIPASKIDPFARLERSLPTDGILDTTAGFVLADKACTWALHLIQQSPHVTTYFAPSHALQSLTSSGPKYTGITTTSNTHHTADFILLATGGWTPTLLPTVSHLLETTAGSVLSIQIPPARPDLIQRFSPSNFPVWSWNMSGYSSTSIGGLYGLPATPSGLLKFGFRGAKWTSYTRTAPDGTPLSYPKTDIGHDRIPAEAMRVVRAFCEENMPELLELDLASCRLCWYTDSIDNSWLIDYVPDKENLVVASGGSGHGFKFLPVLGEHIVDVIEKKDTEYTRLFKWRDMPEGKRNGLEEGPEGWRNLVKQKFVGNREWRGQASGRL